MLRRSQTSTLLAVACSAGLLLPCFWQARIQAGDLASHVYNAWLALLIERRQAPGLYVEAQWSNALFDPVLSFLFRYTGQASAERISVAFSVLVLAWGAFVLACAASRRRPWFLFPCIAMLAYGWVFHMGFFNYYLSLGLCLFALALCWTFSWMRLAGALALLAIAGLAHVVPVGWAVLAFGYLAIARRIRPRRWPYLTMAVIGSLCLLHFCLGARYEVRWSWKQSFAISGLDQLLVFGSKYFLVAGALLAIWSLLFLRLLEVRGVGRTLLALPLQLCVCGMAAVVLLPGVVFLPGHAAPLSFLTERLSLIVALSVCMVLGAAEPRRWQKAACFALLLPFFGFLYRDEQALNRVEDQVRAAVLSLPPNQRVVAAPLESASRIDAFAHMIDRACIGHCFSYANYEPSSAAFRVRVRGANPIVTSDYHDSCEMQKGTYRVLESDLPLFRISRCDPQSDRFCTVTLAAGEIIRSAATVEPQLQARVPDLRRGSGCRNCPEHAGVTETTGQGGIDADRK